MVAGRQKMKLKGTIVKVIHFSPKKGKREFQNYIKITGIPFIKIKQAVK
jgi:hypothetical protein